MRFPVSWLLAGLLAALWSGPVVAGRVHVAVAANFTAVMERLVQRFEAAGDHSVVTSFGSSGTLYAQIRNGAPFEILLSADVQRPRRLEAQGLAVAGSRFTYAVGQLVLWSRDPGRVAGRRTLRRDDFRYLAIADPRIAPYGAAARQVLERLGQWERLQDRLVWGENVSQAYRFVASGNAELGFVARVQLGATPPGSLWKVPGTLHAPIEQQAVLLQRGRDKPAALAFLAFLRGPQAQALIRGAGYR